MIDRCAGPYDNNELDVDQAESRRSCDAQPDLIRRAEERLSPSFTDAFEATTALLNVKSKEAERLQRMKSMIRKASGLKYLSFVAAHW